MALRLIYKLTLATILPALLIWGVGFYATREAERSLRTAIEKTSLTRARTVMGEIDRAVQRRMGNWQAYAQGKLIQDTLEKSNADMALEEDAQAWIDARDVAWRADPNRATNLRVAELLDHELSGDLRAHIEALEQDAGYPVVNEVFLTNRFGAVVALSSPTSDFRQDDEDWWQQAKKERVYLGDVKWDASAGERSVEICLRVERREGEFLGVLKAVLNIRELTGIVDELADKGDRLILFTSDQRIISVRDTADEPTPQVPVEELLGSDPGEKPKDWLADGSAYFKGVTLDEDHDVASCEALGPDGTRKLRAFALSKPHARFPGLGWSLVSERDAATVFEPIEELRNDIWLLAMLATLLALLIGGYFAFSISRRVQRVSDATVEIAAGRLQTHVPEEGHDELSTLAERFNRMSDELARADEALREARDEAEAANAAKSLFLANMSHEIRTPLTGVLGVTDLLARSDLPAEQRDRLGMLRESGQTLRRLIDDMLDFSKIEAGKVELERIDFQLRDVVGRGVQSLAPKAADKGLELACRIDPAVPDDLIGDPGRLQQVLLNLAGNAIKFTESGEVVIEVDAGPVRNDQVELTFSVRDTGIGIQPEARQRIFESFAQADASTTRKYGGTGLGLSISARLVELMQGEITLETAEEDGTTFRFTARFDVDPARKQPARPPLESLADLAVLVVDDNSTNRAILDELLHAWGLAPKTVADAEQALEELRRAEASRRPYPLVLTDLCMPEMDGFEFAERVRDDDALGNPTVIMLSSGKDAGDPARSRAVGVSRYLTKPVVQSDLLEAITACMDPGAAERAGTKEPTSAWPEAEAPLRILLAEDGLINQHVICGYLVPHGHTVRVVHDGQQVLDALAAESFDLVLMDLQMPVMDGVEATRCIRAREAEDGGHIPIVALTAAAMPEDRARSERAGMDAHVAKPVDADELFEVIRRVVTESGDAATGDATSADDPGPDQPRPD